GIAAGGQDDLEIGVEIATAIEALALETQRLAGVDAGRQVQLDRTIQRRHPHLGPQHGFIKRDRYVGAQVGAVAAELPGLAEADSDERIARLTQAGRTLALEADLLAVLDLFGKLDVEHLAGGHAHRDRTALVGVYQRYGCIDDDVLALGAAPRAAR